MLQQTRSLRAQRSCVESRHNRRWSFYSTRKWQQQRVSYKTAASERAVNIHAATTRQLLRREHSITKVVCYGLRAVDFYSSAVWVV